MGSSVRWRESSVVYLYYINSRPSVDFTLLLNSLRRNPDRRTSRLTTLPEPTCCPLSVITKNIELV